LKVLAPILVKVSLMDAFNASIEVSIPTKAIMPKEIISAVSTVRNKLLRMASMAMRRFSSQTLLTPSKIGGFWSY